MKQIDEKKELIDYNYKKKEQMELLKHDLFLKKQNAMNENTNQLWELKKDLVENSHNLHLQRMYLYWKMKNNTLRKEDFNLIK